MCKIAARADARFGAFGLTNARRILIRIPEGTDRAPEHSAAVAHLGKGILEVLPVDSLKVGTGSVGPFPMLSAPVLFESLIVHELAHAYIDQMAGGRFVSRLAHEYLAYALQLDLLPELERALILQQAGISRPVEIDDFHEAALNFSPLRYAAMAWLHFKRQKDRANFVQSIIEGEVVLQSLRE